MGRYLKNTQLEGGSYAIQIPLGSSSIGPDSPVNGQMRFNQTTSKIEFYYNGQWNEVAKIGRVNIVTDTFTTADGPSTQQFTMSYEYRDGQESNILVFVGGVQQKPGNGSATPNNYYFNTGYPSNQLYITPNNGDAGQTVLVIHNFNSTDAA
jgi:hypothetical protein